MRGACANRQNASSLDIGLDENGSIFVVTSYPNSAKRGVSSTSRCGILVVVVEPVATPMLVEPSAWIVVRASCNGSRSSSGIIGATRHLMFVVCGDVSPILPRFPV